MCVFSVCACVRMCECVCMHMCACVAWVCVYSIVITLHCTGLNEANQYGDSLIERQVPWVVPDHLYTSSPLLPPKTDEYDDEYDDDDYEIEKEKKVSTGMQQQRELTHSNFLM